MSAQPEAWVHSQEGSMSAHNKSLESAYTQEARTSTPFNLNVLTSAPLLGETTCACTFAWVGVHVHFWFAADPASRQIRRGNPVPTIVM